MHERFQRIIADRLRPILAYFTDVCIFICNDNVLDSRRDSILRSYVNILCNDTRYTLYIYRGVYYNFTTGTMD